ncbi:increased rDNA silencing protein 4 [Blumeria hordei DH14]|uniref:Increased rDNA silencing protein 4 n=1 Tax=Blumeria graminis f. sp. hordei (strain DH14) TaxID=546991 RepID=N1JHI2_BLUG1|nr:increased rDNA silencing protein 4 [Blumeria hordei DH14]
MSVHPALSSLAIQGAAKAFVHGQSRPSARQSSSDSTLLTTPALVAARAMTVKSAGKNLAASHLQPRPSDASIILGPSRPKVSTTSHVSTPCSRSSCTQRRSAGEHASLLYRTSSLSSSVARDAAAAAVASTHRLYMQSPTSSLCLAPSTITLKPTLRMPHRSDCEDSDPTSRSSAQQRRSLLHPNRHQRRRRRATEIVTDRQRRRYEAVWASNRGLYLDPRSHDAAMRLCNLVVRDIWSRSRLGPDVLHCIYELIDRDQCGSLRRDEFVVGMWLIDRSLRGRKIPSKISDSIWLSVN